MISSYGMPRTSAAALVVQVEARPARAKAARACGEHEAPGRRCDRAPAARLGRARPAVGAALDAGDDVHRHLVQVLEQVEHRVEQPPPVGREIEALDCGGVDVAEVGTAAMTPEVG